MMTAAVQQQATHLIVGGGAAGCVLANRLSANPNNQVVLVEAGPDTPLQGTPADILASYPGRAMANMNYFWPQLRARCGGSAYPQDSRDPAFFHQARVMGGGSSINAQIALRGLPRDFDTKHSGTRTELTLDGVKDFAQMVVLDIKK